MSESKPVVVLATSNGTGMGHLSRQLAVGHALTGQAEPRYFSLSRAVGVIRHQHGRGEYCPSRERGWLPAFAWHDYLRERLVAFVRETGATTVVFDGVVPYNGLILARAELADVRFVWMRRGFWHPGANTAPLRTSEYFDLVLAPGDFAADGDTGATAGRTDAVELPPISQLAHLPLLPRAEARAELGLDPDRPTALVTLSSGVLNDVATPGAAAVEALLANPQWQVAVTRSQIAASEIPFSDHPRCVVLQGVYPLAKYLSAFDAAVAAGGYNSVHELLSAQVPTLFVPNRTSGTDDQPARTRWLADRGYALYAEENDVETVARQARALQDDAEREKLRAACAELPAPDGSTAAATEIMRLQDRAPTPPSGRALAVLRAKNTAARALGPRGTALARRALKRPPAPGPSAPLPVQLADDLSPAPADGTRTLRFSADLNCVLQTEDPLEHLVDGSSDVYRKQREGIVRRHYDVRPGVSP